MWLCMVGVLSAGILFTLEKSSGVKSAMRALTQLPMMLILVM